MFVVVMVPDLQAWVRFDGHRANFVGKPLGLQRGTRFRTFVPCIPMVGLVELGQLRGPSVRGFAVHTYGCMGWFFNRASELSLVRKMLVCHAVGSHGCQAARAMSLWFLLYLGVSH